MNYDIHIFNTFFSIACISRMSLLFYGLNFNTENISRNKMSKNQFALLPKSFNPHPSMNVQVCNRIHSMLFFLTTIKPWSDKNGILRYGRSKMQAVSKGNRREFSRWLHTIEYVLVGVYVCVWWQTMQTFYIIIIINVAKRKKTKAQKMQN